MKVLNMSGRNTSSENTGSSRKTWKWMLIDSAIVGGIATFAAINSAGPTWGTAWVAFKAFGAAFLLQLYVERGLKR